MAWWPRMIAAVCGLVPLAASAQESVPVSTSTLDYSIEAPLPSSSRPVPVLVEEFTAHTLASGEIQLGTELDVGITGTLDIGTDLVSAIVGAPSFKIKALVYDSRRHKVSLGLRAAYLSKKTLLWGSVNDHFDQLEARIIRPAISWTHQFSPRLSLHTFWAKGFGPLQVKLSPTGQRKLWETKHPGADYATRDQDTQAPTEEDPAPDDSESESSDDTVADRSTGENQEQLQEKSALHHQSVQVQSIAGLAQDRFQMTGEYQRIGGNKVLITTRIEQAGIEALKTNFIRLTIAHQWIWDTFQMRLGVGAQYFAIAGRDLDDEVIDKTDVEPASDISFYWRF